MIIIKYYTNYKQYEFHTCKLKIKFFMEINDRGIKICYLNIIRHLYSSSAGKVKSIWTRVISMWKLKLILIYIVTWIVKNLTISLYYSYYFIKKVNIDKYNYYLLITIQTNTLKFLKYIHIVVIQIINRINIRLIN